MFFTDIICLFSKRTSTTYDYHQESFNNKGFISAIHSIIMHSVRLLSHVKGQFFFHLSKRLTVYICRSDFVNKNIADTV